MNRDEIREGLEQAGLSKYQADAFLTLLEQGVSPAVDVAKNCSVPTPRIYDVLKDLERMGYVETVDRDTLHARARNPVDVIEELHERSERLADTASEIEDRWERSPLGEHEVNVLRRADAAVDHAKDLIRDADTVVDVAATDAELLGLENALADVDDDVHVRASVYFTEHDPASVDAYSAIDVVTELRERTVPGPLLVIVDRTAACFSPTTRLPDPYGLVLNDDIISFVFQWYFQTCLWSVWEPVSDRRSFPLEYVSLDEFIRDVFPLWRDGAAITATVHGIDTESGDARTVTGTVTDITYTGMDVTNDCPPTVGQLAGRSLVGLSTADRTYRVGSWGALFEEIEARRIVLESIELDYPSHCDCDRDVDDRTDADLSAAALP